jgi:hypothetical protein
LPQAAGGVGQGQQNPSQILVELPEQVFGRFQHQLLA